jgi:glutamate N-acetyltransferase / amino-acid N-acetyltransferase/acetylglutamate kinase
MKTPLGFRYAGVHAGLKPVRRDLALIASEVPAAAAGCFTTNLAKAAPIVDAEARVPSSGIRAIVVNSGNANALTGSAGAADVRAICGAVADALGVSREAVLSASTGVIGAPMPAGKIVAAAPALVAALGAAPAPAAEAIITTDTRTKLASRTILLGGREVTLSAIAKGSGMIAPQLATLIAIITTDAAIAPAMLDRALHAAIEPSFHCLVVDGETSTNDTVYALANGLAGNPPIVEPGADLDVFTRALTEICIEIAREVAADGEGATRLLEVTVRGAPTPAIARDLARSIAASVLVKAAMFGADPNWGRILATVGARAGARRYAIDPHKAEVAIQGVVVFAGEEPRLADAPALRAKMRAPEVRVDVALAAGDASATAWGCDLSYDYVKINADYTSLIVQTPDGALAKDDRLTRYSPSFKRTLLVEALSYIAKFAGTRCVVQYGGSGVRKASLEQAFCDDIKLLRSVGLQPIVVHGGGQLDAERLSGGSPDVKMIEMVLGGINAELVTLLNLDGAHAIGVSGKDGALLRARRLEGHVGEVTRVNATVIEMLLGQSFVPVISPIALGDDGASYTIAAEAAAAAIAVALGAPKLIFLADVAGIIEHDELLTDLTAADIERRRSTLPREIDGAAILTALRGGVGRVHIIDGRTPHSLIAELFTDRGVGTLITP